MTEINNLIQEIRKINTNNGWNVLQTEEWANDYKIPAILALIHSEVSEALEAFRKRDKENFYEEIADITIRVFDLASGLPFDLEQEIKNKLEKNKQRGYKHGNKRI